MDTTQLHGFGSYAGYASLVDYVAQCLGEFVGDYDVDGIVNEVRNTINEQLAEVGISMHGDDFYSTWPAPEDARDLIVKAIEEVDVAGIAAGYELEADADAMDEGGAAERGDWPILITVVVVVYVACVGIYALLHALLG